MHRFIYFSIIWLLVACQPSSQIITVKGRIADKALGRTLSHEHILVDFIGADSTGYHRWQRDSVVAKVLPYLQEVKKMGYQSLVECTPAYLGRDPRLLVELANKSGLQILTNTGYYGARENIFLPKHAFKETAEELAARWIAEFKSGIEDTGIRPGFIKISIDRGVPLSAIHQKIVRAAAITHRQTGLPIASHTGPAPGAFAQLEILKQENVFPDAWIWVHAQNAESPSHIEAVKQGAWVSLDNVSAKKLEKYVADLSALKKAGLLERVLISHDAGWYRPGEAGGGAFRPYTDIDQYLIPALKEVGFSEEDIHLLQVENPARAYSIRMKE